MNTEQHEHRIAQIVRDTSLKLGVKSALETSANEEGDLSFTWTHYMDYGRVIAQNRSLVLWFLMVVAGNETAVLAPAFQSAGIVGLILGIVNMVGAARTRVVTREELWRAIEGKLGVYRYSLIVRDGRRFILLPTDRVSD